MKVLIAVDTSPASAAAVGTAAELFGAVPDTSFVVLGVIETSLPVGPGSIAESLGPMLVTPWEQILSARQAAAEAAVDDAVARLPGAHTLVATGDPAQRICEAAEEQDADVVVVGGTDRGLLGRLLDPPVADDVVHRAPRPVLVVHAETVR